MTRTVLFVAHTDQVSGAEKVLLRLIDQALAEGYRAVVACPSGPLSDRLPPNATHVRLPRLGLTGQSGAARLIGAVRMLLRWWSAGRTLRPHVRDPDSAVIVNSMFALPALRLAHPRDGVAWLVHDTMTSTKQRAVTRLARPVVRLAVAVSEATAVPLRAAGFPVAVAHNGVRWPVPQMDVPLHAPPVIGMLALLTPWKGHSVLLEAAATLPGVEIEFAGGSFPGDDAYVADLRARADQPDLVGRVRFLGHQDPETAMRRWDALVSASVSPEAGPLNVLEAMSYGLPVIGTAHGGTVEFLCDGAGLLVPPDDADALAKAIEQVLSDDLLRSSLAETGRRRIARSHDINTTAPAMLAALLPAAGGRG